MKVILFCSGQQMILVIIFVDKFTGYNGYISECNNCGCTILYEMQGNAVVQM